MFASSRRSGTAFVVALALVASACGGDVGTDSPPAAATTTAAPAEDSAPATTPPPPEEPSPEEPVSTTTEPSAEEPSPEEPSAEEPRPESPPYRAELDWGTFLLADRIAEKLTLDQTFRFVLSVEATSDGGSGPAMGAGWSRGGVEAAERHSATIDAQVIGPWAPDPDAQAAEIDGLLVAGEVDCLAVEAPATGELARVIDRVANSGVPVFTVGADSTDSKRFALYGADDRSAGRRTGQTVGRWAVDGRILLRKAAVFTGDADDPRFRARMEGFIAGISEELPDIEFVNSPGTVASFGFDPDEVYVAATEWILANPDVDIIFHTDEGMEMAARVIAELGLYGDVSLAGFHMSDQVVNYVYEGVVVAAMVPGLANQAAAAAAACGDFLFAGVYDTANVAVDPTAVTEENLEERDWTSPENA